MIKVLFPFLLSRLIKYFTELLPLTNLTKTQIATLDKHPRDIHEILTPIKRQTRCAKKVRGKPSIWRIALVKILILVPMLQYSRDCRHFLAKRHRNVRSEALHWDLFSIPPICTQTGTLETLCKFNFESVLGSTKSLATAHYTLFKSPKEI